MKGSPGPSNASNSATGSQSATATPAEGHVPVLPGSSGSGPSITTPAYVDAPLTGSTPTWKALDAGGEIWTAGSSFAVRFDPATIRFVLHAGSQVPGGSGWTGGSFAATKGLVAGWNGGFLLANGASWGGIYIDGRTAFGPLKAGTASEVFYKDGTLDVITWPGGTPGPDVVGVRQNLVLLVSDGKLAANLNLGTSADEHNWGFTNNSSDVHGNRSAVGVTADGKVVYVAVKGASPLQLAQFVQRAGAVRAMALDMNFTRPIFGAYSNGRWSQPEPWLGAAAQFTSGDQRDFVAVYAR